jgi:AcrR family transcriptional regulator
MNEPGRKEREFHRREQEILDAALALCASPDWEAVSVEQIAERAEVGKGTVYKHFASKDELLFQLMMRFYHSLLERLRGSLIDGSPAQQMRFIFAEALRYHLERREYRYVVEYCERSDFKERAPAGWRDDFLELDQAFQEWGTPIIEEGMARGEFAERPATHVLLGIHAAFKGAVDMIWVDQAWCPHPGGKDAIVEAVTDFMMLGVIGRQ